MTTFVESFSGVPFSGQPANPAQDAIIEPQPADSGVDFDLLRAEEVAKLVGVHKVTVLRWVADGKLRAMKVGKVVRIRRVDLAAFVRANLSAQS